MQLIEVMPTKIQKRRVIYCKDQLWNLVEFLGLQTEYQQSEVMRALLEYLQEQDRKELLKIVKERGKK